MKGREVFDQIPEEVCRELEAIVGSEHITTDPNIRMASYGFGFGHEVYWFQGIVQPPAAIVMPKTTEEVAKIVKVCNRYGIPYFAVSSGCLVTASPCFLQNVVNIDLKRMNNLEIDEKNMFAIVESGVTAGQVSAEANKRDMYYVITGGGGLVGALCNNFSFGWGHFCWRATPQSQRRWTGIEWVSPEGEIYRMGSLASGDDNWFCGEGLGPNVSGLLYGLGGGWNGAMGITTRLALRLYPFQPEPLEPQGMGGDSGVKLPARVKYYNISFPTKEALLKSIDKIGEADIAHVVNIVPSFWRTMAKCPGVHDIRNEFYEAWGPVTEDEVRKTNILRVLLVGRTSLKQLEYEERVLLDIVNENGGTPRRAKPLDEGTFRYANTADMWMMTGCYAMTTASFEVTRVIKAQNEMFRDRLVALPFKKDYMDQKGELPWYLMWARGRVRYTENHVQPDARVVDPEDPDFNPELTTRFVPWAVSEGPFINFKTGSVETFGGVTHPFWIESQANQHFEVWARKFKQEFDPKGVSGAVWPWAIDKVVEGAPAVVTEELRELLRKTEQGPWLGNPE